jgi:hypothetical protein
LKTVLGADLAPQRPRYARERAELASHILEPEWVGKRALARVGHSGPHFVGYDGEVDGPRELYDAIVAEAHCTTAIIDGVLVADWHDESELELDPEGNAFTRNANARQIFAAFDLLEVDGESLLEIPLLERKRHLEGLLVPQRERAPHAVRDTWAALLARNAGRARLPPRRTQELEQRVRSGPHHRRLARR